MHILDDLVITVISLLFITEALSYVSKKISIKIYIAEVFK